MDYFLHRLYRYTLYLVSEISIYISFQPVCLSVCPSSEYVAKLQAIYILEANT